MWERILVVGKSVAMTATNLIDKLDAVFSESQLRKEKEVDTFAFFCYFIHTLGMKGNLFLLMITN